MTSNCSRPMKWFETYVEYAKPFHRASITASLHVEHVNTKEKMQEFADKLILCQEHDVQITINQVMVPEHFERDWENALFFHEQGINAHPTQATIRSTASKKWLMDTLRIILNDSGTVCHKESYTESKRKWQDRSTFRIKGIMGKNDASVPRHMQVELQDLKR